jgi:hypothetical protein
VAENKFLVWNPAAVNQETDDQYAADALRTGGAPSGQLFPSTTANKLFHQLSTFVAALGQALAAKGYEMTDAALNDLAGQLANVMTAADMAPYALLASPHFTGVPTAPTPSPDDASGTIPTTAWVRGVASFAEAGYQRFASGLVLQWCKGTLASGDSTQTVNFPIPFPTACLHVQATNQPSGSNQNIAKGWGVQAWTKTGATVILQRRGDEGSFQATPLIFAIGH